MNYTHIKRNFYLVETQAGLKQAIKAWANGNFDSFEEKPRVVGYPKAYPSVVCINEGYSGYTYIKVSCIHVNTLKDAIEGV